MRTDQEVLSSGVGRTLGIAVLIAAFLTLPLALAENLDIPPPATLVGDWLVWGVFFVEYVAMLFLTRDPVGYASRNLLNLAVVILTFPLLPQALGAAGLFRVATSMRLFRLMRVITLGAFALSTLRTVLGRPTLLYASALTLFLICLGALLMLNLEPDTVKNSIGNAVWWAIVTASTVGYGDISPHSIGGRTVAVFLMMAGIGLISTLSATIAAHFVGSDEGTDLRDLDRRLQKMERQLEQIETLLTSRPAPAPNTPPPHEECQSAILSQPGGAAPLHD